MTTWRKASAAAVCAVLAFGAAGCSSGTSSSGFLQPVTPVDPSQSTSATPDNTATAGQEGLAAYRGYRTALTRALRDGDPRAKDLAQYAADKALADARTSLLRLEQQGIVYVGEPVTSPTVTRVALDDVRPTVELADCIDNTDWRPVYAASGKSAAAPGQAQRVPLVVTVQELASGWRVMAVTSDRSRPC